MFPEGLVLTNLNSTAASRRRSTCAVQPALPGTMASPFEGSQEPNVALSPTIVIVYFFQKPVSSRGDRLEPRDNTHLSRNRRRHEMNLDRDLERRYPRDVRGARSVSGTASDHEGESIARGNDDAGGSSLDGDGVAVADFGGRVPVI